MHVLGGMRVLGTPVGIHVRYVTMGSIIALRGRGANGKKKGRGQQRHCNGWLYTCKLNPF